MTTAALAQRSAAGFGWNVAGGAARAGAGLAVNAVLARLLGPEPFGQVALLMAGISLGTLVVECGLGTGLIQKAQVEEADARAAFTLQMTAGLGLALATAMAAPWLARGLGQAPLAPLVAVLALVLPLQAFGQTGAALLRRRLDFQRLQQLQLASYLLGYLGLGIPLALRGSGAWSLVAAQLAQTAAYSLGAWRLAGHSLRPLWPGGYGALARFGMSITAGNIAAWATVAVPPLLIGRWAGMTELGLYSRAFFVASTPAAVLASSLQTTTLPLHSRLRGHRRVANRAHLGILAVSQWASLPLFCAAAAMPATVIAALFGEGWSAAAGLLTPLALAMPLECVAALSGPLLTAVGRPGVEFRVQLVTALSALATVGVVAARGTVAEAAWAVMMGVYGVRALAGTVATIRVTGMSGRAWLRAVSGSAAVGALVYGLVAVAEGWLAGMGAWPRMTALGLLALAVAVGAAVAAPRQVLGLEGVRMVTRHLAPLWGKHRGAAWS